MDDNMGKYTLIAHLFLRRFPDCDYRGYYMIGIGNEKILKKYLWSGGGQLI